MGTFSCHSLVAYFSGASVQPSLPDSTTDHDNHSTKVSTVPMGAKRCTHYNKFNIQGVCSCQCENGKQKVKGKPRIGFSAEDHYHCRICDFVTYYPGFVVRHEVMVHGARHQGLKIFECACCPKLTIQLSEYARHIKRHVHGASGNDLSFLMEEISKCVAAGVQIFQKQQQEKNFVESLSAEALPKYLEMRKQMEFEYDFIAALNEFTGRSETGYFPGWTEERFHEFLRLRELQSNAGNPVTEEGDRDYSAGCTAGDFLQSRNSIPRTGYIPGWTEEMFLAGLTPADMQSNLPGQVEDQGLVAGDCQPALIVEVNVPSVIEFNPTDEAENQPGPSADVVDPTAMWFDLPDELAGLQTNTETTVEDSNMMDSTAQTFAELTNVQMPSNILQSRPQTTIDLASDPWNMSLELPGILTDQTNPLNIPPDTLGESQPGAPNVSQNEVTFEVKVEKQKKAKRSKSKENKSVLNDDKTIKAAKQSKEKKNNNESSGKKLVKGKDGFYRCDASSKCAYFTDIWEHIVTHMKAFHGKEKSRVYKCELCKVQVSNFHQHSKSKLHRENLKKGQSHPSEHKSQNTAPTTSEESGKEASTEIRPVLSSDGKLVIKLKKSTDTESPSQEGNDEGTFTVIKPTGKPAVEGNDSIESPASQETARGVVIQPKYSTLSDKPFIIQFQKDNMIHCKFEKCAYQVGDIASIAKHVHKTHKAKLSAAAGFCDYCDNAFTGYFHFKQHLKNTHSVPSNCKGSQPQRKGDESQKKDIPDAPNNKISSFNEVIPEARGNVHESPAKKAPYITQTLSDTIFDDSENHTHPEPCPGDTYPSAEESQGRKTPTRELDMEIENYNSPNRHVDKLARPILQRLLSPTAYDGISGEERDLPYTSTNKEEAEPLKEVTAHSDDCNTENTDSSTQNFTQLKPVVPYKAQSPQGHPEVYLDVDVDPLKMSPVSNVLSNALESKNSESAIGSTELETPKIESEEPVPPPITPESQQQSHENTLTSSGVQASQMEIPLPEKQTPASQRDTATPENLESDTKTEPQDVTDLEIQNIFSLSNEMIKEMYPEESSSDKVEKSTKWGEWKVVGNIDMSQNKPGPGIDIYKWHRASPNGDASQKEEPQISPLKTLPNLTERGSFPQDSSTLPTSTIDREKEKKWYKVKLGLTRQLECGLCPATQKTGLKMKIHLNEIHKENLSHIICYCQICEASYSTYQAFQHHICQDHAIPESEDVNDSSYPVIKIYVTDSRLVRCSECGFSHADPTVVCNHANNDHSTRQGYWYFKCPWCQMSTSQLSTFQSHLESQRHRNKFSGFTPSPVRPPVVTVMTMTQSTRDACNKKQPLKEKPKEPPTEATAGQTSLSSGSLQEMDTSKETEEMSTEQISSDYVVPSTSMAAIPSTSSVEPSTSRYAAGDLDTSSCGFTIPYEDNSFDNDIAILDDVRSTTSSLPPSLPTSPDHDVVITNVHPATTQVKPFVKPETLEEEVKETNIEDSNQAHEKERSWIDALLPENLEKGRSGTTAIDNDNTAEKIQSTKKPGLSREMPITLDDEVSVTTEIEKSVESSAAITENGRETTGSEGKAIETNPTESPTKELSTTGLDSDLVEVQLSPVNTPEKGNVLKQYEGNIKFTCKECPRIVFFPSMEALMKHKMEYHPQRAVFRCQPCDRQFGYEDFMEHMKSMHPRGMTPQRAMTPQKETTTPPRGMTPQHGTTPLRGTTPQGGMTPQRGTTPQGGMTPQHSMTAERDTTPQHSTTPQNSNKEGIPNKISPEKGISITDQAKTIRVDSISEPKTSTIKAKVIPERKDSSDSDIAILEQSSDEEGLLHELVKVAEEKKSKSNVNEEKDDSIQTELSQSTTKDTRVRNDSSDSDIFKDSSDSDIFILEENDEKQIPRDEIINEAQDVQSSIVTESSDISCSEPKLPVPEKPSPIIERQDSSDSDIAILEVKEPEPRTDADQQPKLESPETGNLEATSSDQNLEVSKLSQDTSSTDEKQKEGDPPNKSPCEATAIETNSYSDLVEAPAVETNLNADYVGVPLKASTQSSKGKGGPFKKSKSSSQEMQSIRVDKKGKNPSPARGAIAGNKQTTPTCALCEEQFSTIEELQTHSSEKHNQQQKMSFECKQCLIKFDNKTLFMIHFKSDEHKAKQAKSPKPKSFSPVTKDINKKQEGSVPREVAPVSPPSKADEGKSPQPKQNPPISENEGIQQEVFSALDTSQSPLKISQESKHGKSPRAMNNPPEEKNTENPQEALIGMEIPQQASQPSNAEQGKSPRPKQILPMSENEGNQQEVPSTPDKSQSPLEVSSPKSVLDASPKEVQEGKQRKSPRAKLNPPRPESEDQWEELSLPQNTPPTTQPSRVSPHDVVNPSVKEISKPSPVINNPSTVSKAQSTDQRRSPRSKIKGPWSGKKDNQVSLMPDKSQSTRPSGVSRPTDIPEPPPQDPHAEPNQAEPSLNTVPIQAEKSPDNVPIPSPVKTYPCTGCQAVFTSQKEMKSHQRQVHVTLHAEIHVASNITFEHEQSSMKPGNKHSRTSHIERKGDSQKAKLQQDAIQEVPSKPTDSQKAKSPRGAIQEVPSKPTRKGFVFNCKNCDQDFTSKKLFLVHLKSEEHKGKVTPKKERKETASNTALLRGKSRYGCKKCAINFCAKLQYLKHLRSDEHRGKVATDKQTKLPSKRPTSKLRVKFGCKWCALKFSSRDAFLVHVLSSQHKSQIKKKTHSFKMVAPVDFKPRSKVWFRCHQCDIKVPNQKLFLAHVKTVEHKANLKNLKHVKGKDNPSDTVSSIETDTHSATKSEQKETIELQVSPARVTRSSSKEATQVSHKMRFTCNKCKLALPNHKELFKHIRSVHQEETRKLRSSTSPKGEGRQLRSSSSPSAAKRLLLPANPSPGKRKQQLRSGISPVRKATPREEKETNEPLEEVTKDAPESEQDKVNEVVTDQDSKDEIKVVRHNVKLQRLPDHEKLQQYLYQLTFYWHHA